MRLSSLVVVTDDVADGVYHENLDVDMDDGVSLEIVGDIAAVPTSRPRARQGEHLRRRR